MDYLRRQKLEQLSECLEGDREALQRTIESMMQTTRRRVQATALGGLTQEDCREVEKRLEEVGGGGEVGEIDYRIIVYKRRLGYVNRC